MNRKVSKFIDFKARTEVLANRKMIKQKDATGVMRKLVKEYKRIWNNTPWNKREELKLQWLKKLQILTTKLKGSKKLEQS